MKKFEVPYALVTRLLLLGALIFVGILDPGNGNAKGETSTKVANALLEMSEEQAEEKFHHLRCLVETQLTYLVVSPNGDAVSFKNGQPSKNSNRLKFCHKDECSSASPHSPLPPGDGILFFGEVLPGQYKIKIIPDAPVHSELDGQGHHCSLNSPWEKEKRTIFDSKMISLGGAAPGRPLELIFSIEVPASREIELISQGLNLDHGIVRFNLAGKLPDEFLEDFNRGAAVGIGFYSDNHSMDSKWGTFDSYLEPSSAFERKGEVYRLTRSKVDINVGQLSYDISIDTKKKALKFSISSSRKVPKPLSPQSVPALWLQVGDAKYFLKGQPIRADGIFGIGKLTEQKPKHLRLWNLPWKTAPLKLDWAAVSSKPSRVDWKVVSFPPGSLAHEVKLNETIGATFWPDKFGRYEIEANLMIDDKVVSKRMIERWHRPAPTLKGVSCKVNDGIQECRPVGMKAKSGNSPKFLCEDSSPSYCEISIAEAKNNVCRIDLNKSKNCHATFGVKFYVYDGRRRSGEVWTFECEQGECFGSPKIEVGYSNKE